MAWRYGSAVPNASDHILEMPISYRVWQAPFAEAKFAPVLAHNDLSAVRRVLDVGCGPGTNAAHFAGSDYVGIDLNPRYIEDAKRRHGRDFRVADATEFSVPEGERFDFILINSFLHHIPDEPTRDLLGNLRRALAPDGHIHVMELVLLPARAWGASSHGSIAATSRGRSRAGASCSASTSTRSSSSPIHWGRHGAS